VSGFCHCVHEGVVVCIHLLSKRVCSWVVLARELATQVLLVDGRFNPRD
jgi:hypothetical protein